MTAERAVILSLNKWHYMYDDWREKWAASMERDDVEAISVWDNVENGRLFSHVTSEFASEITVLVTSAQTRSNFFYMQFEYVNRFAEYDSGNLHYRLCNRISVPSMFFENWTDQVKPLFQKAFPNGKCPSSLWDLTHSFLLDFGVPPMLQYFVSLLPEEEQRSLRANDFAKFTEILDAAEPDEDESEWEPNDMDIESEDLDDDVDIEIECDLTLLSEQFPVVKVVPHEYYTKMFDFNFEIVMEDSSACSDEWADDTESDIELN